MRRLWHRWRLRYHEKRIARATWVLMDAERWRIVHERALLTPVVDPPFRQEFGTVTISGLPDLEAEDPNEIMLDTTHLAGLTVVPDLDEADTPEADHAFWESTAEDILEGYQPWRDDPLPGDHSSS